MRPQMQVGDQLFPPLPAYGPDDHLACPTFRSLILTPPIKMLLHNNQGLGLRSSGVYEKRLAYHTIRGRSTMGEVQSDYVVLLSRRKY